MNFHVITLFPGAFDSYLGESIISRAQREGKIKIKFYNPRDFILKKDRKGKDGNYAQVDHKPYGGGPGMVMQAEPVVKAIEAAYLTIYRKIRNSSKKLKAKKLRSLEAKKLPAVKIIFFSPSGKQFTNAEAGKYAQKFSDIIFICGRYEGVDARVKKIFKAEEVSVGPFVLTGGELPAMIVLDAVSRQIEGVLGNFNSREESRISSSEIYTRPEVFTHKGKKYRVPKVLLSGNHKKINEWKTGR